MLKSGGLLTLIWRADGLGDVLGALSRGFGSLAVQPVHAEPGKPAIRILVRAVKGGRAPTQILPAATPDRAPGVPNEEVTAVLAGKSASAVPLPGVDAAFAVPAGLLNV